MKKNRFLLLIFISFGVIIAIIAIFLAIENLPISAPPPPALPEALVPSPIPSPPTISSALDTKQEREKVIATLPYQKGSVTVEYISQLDSIQAKILVQDAKVYRQKKIEVENFVKSLGVENLCSLNIRWIPLRDILKSLTKEDLFTAGCLP